MQLTAYRSQLPPSVRECSLGFIQQLEDSIRCGKLPRALSIQILPQAAAHARVRKPHLHLSAAIHPLASVKFPYASAASRKPWQLCYRHAQCKPGKPWHSLPQQVNADAGSPRWEAALTWRIPHMGTLLHILPPKTASPINWMLLALSAINYTLHNNVLISLT